MSSKSLRDNFWHLYPLKALNDAEWEALCDGCGLCCLHKLQDDETDEIYCDLPGSLCKMNFFDFFLIFFQKMMYCYK